MIRTQLYLDEDIHKYLTILAKLGRESMAKVARDILKEGIEKKKSLDKTGSGVIQKILAIKATGGPKDLSKNLDHYIYGGSEKT